MSDAPLTRLTARPLGLVDAWLGAPEPDAAGRMGLFRVVFALMYLWHISVVDSAVLSGMPWLYRKPLAVLAALPADPSILFFHTLDAILVATLVVIAFGWRVRAALAVLLVVGVLREGLLCTVAIEEGNVFIAFYLPLFMLVAGPCDQTYSLTAWLRRRAGRPSPAPDDPSGRWFLPARATLVMLAALFVSSALLKAFGSGTWLRDPHVILGVLLERNVKATALGYWPIPMAPWAYHHPTVAVAMQYGILVFEAMFFVVLFGRRIRDLYLATALIFHSVNGLLLLVTFTPVLAAYAMFVNWEAVRRTLRIRLVAPAWADRVPPAAAVAAVVVIAAALAATWHLGASAIFNLGGLIDWQAPWFVVAPLALLWVGITLVGIVRPARDSAPAAA